MTKLDVPSKFNIDNYLNYDFVDFIITSSSNIEYGKVIRVLGSKNTSLLEVLLEDKNYLIPINNSFIIKVDFEDKKILVNNIEEISSLWYLIFYPYSIN